MEQAMLLRWQHADSRNLKKEVSEIKANIKELNLFMDNQKKKEQKEEIDELRKDIDELKLEIGELRTIMAESQKKHDVDMKELQLMFDKMKKEETIVKEWEEKWAWKEMERKVKECEQKKEQEEELNTTYYLE
jgi:hypothetical protein